jgi:hypothetical protein
MRVSLYRFCLGDKKRAEIKLVRRDLYNPGFAFGIPAGNLQACCFQLQQAIGVESEVAVVRFGGLGGLVGCGCLAPGLYVHIHGLSDQRTAQGSDEQMRRIGVRLSVGGIADSQHISRIFQHQMLRTSAGAEEWDVVFSREPNPHECAVETFVRTARTAE